MGGEYHVAKPRSTCHGPHSQIFGYVVFWSRGMSLSIFLYYQLYIYLYTNHLPLPLSLHIQCLYAITRVLPFAVDKASLPKDVEPLAIIISRQISYFIEADDFCAFINYLEPDSPWIQAFMETLKEFTKGGQPFKPFRMWKHYERFGQPESLRGLIGELVRFDPDKRLTAEEALGHEWFREGEGG